MPVSEKQAKWRDDWDDKHMAYQTVKVRKELLAAFRSACAERGDKVNTVLRKAMENYIEQGKV